MTPMLKPSVKAMSTGLLLMIFFTSFWTSVAEFQLQGRDFGLIGLVFLTVTVVFIIYFIRFVRAAKELIQPKPSANTAAQQRKYKWFILVCSLEGVAIFVMANVLIRMDLSDYFIPVVALIVGLHFFPLGYIFKQPFHYIAGVWTSGIALAGILMTQHQVPHYLVVAIVGTGCAIATSAFGIRMIKAGKKAIREAIADQETRIDFHI